MTGGASIAPNDYVDVGYRTIPKGAVNSSGVADMSGCKNVSENFFKKNISSKTSSGELVTSLRDLVPTAPNMGRIVRICGETEDFLMPQGVYSIIVKKKISEDFLITYSNSPEYRKIIMAEKNGSTQVHIRNGEFLNIDIPLPSHEEQMKIGEHFKTLDHLITLHQRKCEETKILKKYMLQKMFPQNGHSVPEIRFSGFTEDWEQRKLGELGSLKNGMNFSKEAMGVGYPFVNLQNIFGNNVIDVSDLGKAMASDSQLKDYNLLNGDVLFVRSSVKLEGVGEAALVPQTLENTTYSGFIIRFRDEYGLDNNFKRFVFGIDSVRNQIMSQATNSANKNISQSVLENLELAIPSKSEQQKIGAYFSNLDNLITLHQQKCDELRNIKKFMLQNMFI